MSAEYKGQDPLEIAKQAERDLNSHEAKQGHSTDRTTVQSGKGASDSTMESGVDEAAASRFPGGDVQYGSAASGAGDNREIPLSEGGDLKENGQPTKAADFEGPGGPEDKARLREEAAGGENDVRSNVRQGGDTIRP